MGPSLNSKTSIYIHDPAKGTNITIPNNKMVLVSYSKITSSNISYTGFGIIVSRVRDELTGKLTEIQSVENISLSLEGNKLIASSESWFRIIVTVMRNQVGEEISSLFSTSDSVTPLSCCTSIIPPVVFVSCLL